MNPRTRLQVIVALLFVLLLSSSRIASFIIDYQWWREAGQFETWVSMLLYRIAPAAAGAVLAFAALWLAHGRGLRFSGVRPSETGRMYRRLVPAAAAVLAILFSGAVLDFWVVMSYAGSRGVTLPPDAWKDPVFGRPLSFYLFDLPFYSELLSFVFGLAILCVLVFWATARGWQLAERFQRWRRQGGLPEQFELEPGALLLPGATSAGFIRVILAVVLVGLAVWVLLGNYRLLLSQHAFMTGADYVEEKITLPLRYVLALAALAAVPLVWTRRYGHAVIGLAVVLGLQLVAPGVVRAVYVRPNEISIERPYIERHIEATRAAFGLDRRSTERMFSASSREAVDAAAHSTLLENIRLWDWRAYGDTIAQIQALRPYYTFPDTDVDRYTINGRIKQVLLSPREIDVRQLPADARQSWVNPHLVYTHGFGVVVSEVNKTTPDGLPILLIADAPPEIRLPGFQLTRPEIYYGESTHDPVLVNTLQEEFDYPSGEQNKYSKYQGSGGFPVGSFWMQLAAAVHFAEPNILFTRYFTPQSRLMIRRNVRQRLTHLAGFLHWDADPYLVIADDGRLVWMVDGYTTSRAHPYSATLPVVGLRGGANYLRNSVKATVDAYTGQMVLYLFEPSDPIIQAYQRLFPNLFRPASDMPADLRQHARYPEGLFRTQAEAYRTFHMRDPQVFYNKEDVWEFARSHYGQSGKPEPMSPTYVVATLPGEKDPEFLLILPFAPRGKDNLIGWMAARCDGDRLGELIFFQLSKQQLVFGPMQIESRIDSDQNISKDLSLWNQQGSRVLRGNLIALPLGETFLYIESIYIQAVEARMPQLKKVVLAMGNRLIYRDTFEQALEELTVGGAPPGRAAPPTASAAGSPPPAPSPASQVPVLTDRLRKLREQAQQLVREIEAIEKEAVRR
jgi:hypothetical protein